VRNRHELGQGSVAERRMVWTADVHHLELDGLMVAVSLLSEEHLQLNPSHRGA
jgi:hypothetical protein